MRFVAVGQLGVAKMNTMNLELRAAVKADEPFLREMLYLALFVPAGHDPLPRSVLNEPSIAKYFDGWGTWAGDRGFVALTDGAPIGAAWLRLFPATDPGYGFVSEQIPELSVAVEPEHRGKGIGTILMQRLIEDAGAISLSCDPTNPARRLYTRLGFEELADSRTMLRRRFEA
jgi:GNAT superfamily N-acetyltransferase